MLALVCAERAIPQTNGMLVYGNLYRVHAGFLELKTGEKQYVVVKVDATTVYWNGKTDKSAAKKDLSLNDEIIAELEKKNGETVAKKVRFLHRGS